MPPCSYLVLLFLALHAVTDFFSSSLYHLSPCVNMVDLCCVHCADENYRLTVDLNLSETSYTMTYSLS